MHWFSTALLIALCAGTAVWTGWLLRRLFVTQPAAVVEPGVAEPATPAVPTAEEPNA